MRPETPGPGAPHATAPFVLRPVTDGDHGVAALAGDLDTTGTVRLRSLFDDLSHDGHARVLLEMPGHDVIDAAGLGVPARARAEVRNAGGTPAVAGARSLPMLEDG